MIWFALLIALIGLIGLYVEARDWRAARAMQERLVRRGEARPLTGRGRSIRRA
jgi:hypothetical protein